jgi:uncharacterized membrane protein YgcG
MGKGTGLGRIAQGLVGVVLVAGVAASCNSSSSGAALSANCSINTDCDSPLICAFGRCHDACMASRDCPDDERCVLSGGVGSCQLPTETTCTTANSLCSTGEVCGTDLQCRAQCTATIPCASGDYCLASGTLQACYAPTSTGDEPTLVADGLIAPDGAVISDGAVSSTDGPVGDGATGSLDGTTGSIDGAGSSGGSGSGGSSGGSSGTGSSGGSDGGDATVSSAADGGDATVSNPGPEASVNTCPSAQTTFAAVGSGDENAYFTSGVGARTTTQMIAFSTYAGPDPASDAGDEVGIIYAQAFDPSTGTPAAPAQPVFYVTNSEQSGQNNINSGTTFQLQSSAISPSGEIVLVYVVNFYLSGSYNDGETMYAAFLSPTSGDAGASDAGGAGFHLDKLVLLETASVYGQPHAIWANGSGAFVLSWGYSSGGNFVKIRKFLPSGQAAGGDSDAVPTDSPSSYVDDTSHESGAVGVSGNLFGVSYMSSVTSHAHEFTLLDAMGNEIGTPIEVVPPGGDDYWGTVSGTPQGFVYLFDYQPVTGAFLPLDSDGGIAVPAADAGFSTFTLGANMNAVEARTLSDDMNGQGGVAVDLLYPDEVSFAYVNANGVGHQGPVQVFSRSNGSGDYTSMTNLNGSFVVSLYVAANHQTFVSASGCGP